MSVHLVFGILFFANMVVCGNEGYWSLATIDAIFSGCCFWNACAVGIRR